MYFDWIIRRQSNIEAIEKLSKELGNLHPILTNIFLSKNIDTRQKVIDFVSPKLEKLYDPHLMEDMHKAVKRIVEAINYSEKILIYGDYDVDGTTAVAMMYTFLKKLTNNIDFYVPDRYTEGYGVSFKGIDFAKQNDFSLIITLDCGIKAVDKVEYAKQKGIDIIICDHHSPGNQIPNATAVLNPKKTTCNYPFKELTGCGVGFKLVQALANYYQLNFSEIEDLLDFVVISIASDIVPIVDENRILAYYGLQKLQNTSKPGLVAIKKYSGLENNTNITISDIVFRIGPRINAAGRIEHASYSVKLLLEQDIQKAEELAQKLNQFNTERKSEQDSITKEIIKILSENEDLQSKKSIVVYNENWSKGVVGIVASKIIEYYYKPTIVLTKNDDNNWTGSARSIENFDLYEAIEQCSHLLSNYGGHKFAAGVTIEEENLQQFIECFEKAVSKKITPEHCNPKIEISGIIKFSEINERFLKVIEALAPFGPENMNPIFLTTSVVDTGYSTQVGKNNEHLKLVIEDSSKTVMNAIAFNMGHLYEYIKDKKPFDICYHVTSTFYQNEKKIQLVVKDIRLT